jgi:hypothetical protein
MRLFVFQPQEAKNLTTEATVVGMCRDNATLHVGGITVDMGAQRMGFFFPKIPVGASGEMYLEQNGRKGPTRNLMRWQPVFKVTGAGDNGLSYQITFRLQARAIAQSFPERLASFAWGSSTPYFSAAIGPQASVVTWSASGEATVDNFRYVHSGGSTANLSPVTDTFSSDDGATATIGVISDVPLEYTTTTTNLDDQSVSTSTGYLTSGFTVESLTLQNNWTGAGGSQEYGGGSDTMTWSAFSPSPLFDPNTTRR